MFCRQTKLPFVTTTLIILIATLGACARRTGVERLAVMPIENLTSDTQLNWRSRAAASVVVYDLAGAKNIFARQVDSLSAAQSMQASRLLTGYFFVRNGRAGIRAAVEDLAKTKAVESFEIDGPEADGFLALANQLARRLSSDARRFGTSNETAFRFYGEALVGKDSQAVEHALQQATQADPGFAAGYVDEAKVLVETGDRERARQILKAEERASLDSIDRANLQYVAATASGDTTDRMKALESLIVATPANANIFQELGEMRVARREFQRAAMEYRAASRLDPDEPQIWNELGYALAWAKDVNGAREALAQYGRLAPDDVNVLDSQGEVSYMLGDFKAADEYFERAAAKNPSEFLKAAEARMMMGDLPGADALFAKHLGPSAGARNAGADYQMAQWEFLTGRRKEGMDRMQKLAQESSGDLQALALSQMSIWKVEGGESGAAALASQAAARAQSPQARGMAAMCASIASGSTGSGSKIGDAYGLFISKKYREALPLLQGIYGETNPSGDWQVRTLLAWVYRDSGANNQAAALVDPYPLPLSSGDALFSAVIFQRYLALRKGVR